MPNVAALLACIHSMVSPNLSASEATQKILQIHAQGERTAVNLVKSGNPSLPWKATAKVTGCPANADGIATVIGKVRWAMNPNKLCVAVDLGEGVGIRAVCPDGGAYLTMKSQIIPNP